MGQQQKKDDRKAIGLGRRKRGPQKSGIKVKAQIPDRGEERGLKIPRTHNVGSESDELAEMLALKKKKKGFNYMQVFQSDFCYSEMKKFKQCI